VPGLGCLCIMQCQESAACKEHHWKPHVDNGKRLAAAKSSKWRKG
jgi:hypothetical protein